jgi:protein-L-isoaspartate(D-aspartate) O-methyltransferase
MEFVDTYRHKGLRRRLIEDLREMGIKDERVLDAIYNVPRHYFLASAFLKYAYDNKAFQIGAGQTISQPFTVAKQTELLKVEKGDKILEIGTGSGFQTCVLCEMGAKVWSIERQKELFDKAKPLINALGHRPNLYYGDGYKGKPAFAPFNKIIVTCGAPFIPEALLSQLALGGTLVIPVGEGRTQRMIELTRNSETDFSRKEHGDFAFVPMLSDRAR